MEGPFAVVNGVGDAATGAVKDIGTGITGVPVKSMPILPVRSISLLSW